MHVQDLVQTIKKAFWAVVENPENLPYFVLRWRLTSGDPGTILEKLRRDFSSDLEIGGPGRSFRRFTWRRGGLPNSPLPS